MEANLEVIPGCDGMDVHVASTGETVTLREGDRYPISSPIVTEHTYAFRPVWDDLVFEEIRRNAATKDNP